MTNPQQPQYDANQLRALFGGAETFQGVDPAGESKFPKIEIPGEYAGEVSAVKIVKSKRAVNQTEFFVMEFKLTHSSVPEVQIGGTYSWLNDIRNQYYGLSNIKQWLAAMLGIDPEDPRAKQLTVEHMVQAVMDPRLVVGKPFLFSVHRHDTQAGRVKWVHNFKPFPQQLAQPQPGQ